MSFSASAAAVVEGDWGTVWVTGQPGTRFEFWAADVSADGSDYYNITPGWSWILGSGYTSFGISFATYGSPDFELKESFKVYVRPLDDPDSVIEVEVDLVDRDAPLYPDGTMQYRYDFANRLVRRTFDPDGAGSEPATDTFYSYEGGQIALQFDGPQASDLSHRYLWGPAVDQLLADEQVTSLTSPGNILWPLADHQGTIRDLVTYNSTTNTRTIVLHRRYDSFGNLVSAWGSLLDGYPVQSGAQLAAAAADEIFGYTGRLFDEATGLQNNLNRWYDPKTGRWTSEDPIGFAGGDTNLQSYVLNNPLSWVDPLGLENRRSGLKLPVIPIGQLETMGAKLFPFFGDQYLYGRHTVNEGNTVFNNTDYMRGDPLSRGYTVIGTILGSQFGVRQCSDAFHRNDAVDGHEQSVTEQRIKLGVGVVQLGMTGFAAGRIVMPKPRVTGGRLGSTSTRDHVSAVADELSARGYDIKGGGGRFPEEYIPGPGGARKGSAYPDITATKNNRTIRVNTIDTCADGVTPTAREARNAAKIRRLTPGDHLILMPKPKR